MPSPADNNILQLRGGVVNGASQTVNFRDKSKYETWVFMGPPTASIERQISALGCGFSPGATASLDRDRLLYVTRKYRLICWDNGLSIDQGGSFNQCELNARAVENQIFSASLFNQNPVDRPTELTADGDSVTAHKVWLERRLYDQAQGEVWTILTGTRGKAGRVHEERYGMPRIVLEFELLCMEGADFVLAGVAMDVAVPATIFAAPTLATAVAPAVSGTIQPVPTFGA